ncbi:MAG: hypothetical protein KC449_02045 [Anaerolineales bacterium]|nr:hypothetical protein [Anaerolineales bacterium]
MNSPIVLQTHKLRNRPKWSKFFILALLLPLIAVLLGIPHKQALSASQITLDVRDYDTGLAISAFTYLVNVDNTGDSSDDPVDCDPNTPGYPADCQWPSIQPMPSYSPVVGLGDETAASFSLPDAGEGGSNGRYLISVRADGYKLGGAHISLPDQAGVVLVELVPAPLPLSAIRVNVFHDNYPTNAANDNPGPEVLREEGLEGFRVVIGDTVGEVSVDWYGNPICTEYDGVGTSTPLGDPIPGTGGVCWTDANGDVLIANIPRGKYEIQAIPPDGEEDLWIQTTTIEGTRVIDAWIMEGADGWNIGGLEGFQTPLVLHGFVQRCEFGNTTDTCPDNDVAGTGTITGRFRFFQEYIPATNPLPLGDAVYKPWVALTAVGATDRQVYLGRGDEDGYFTINDVPDGTYQLVVWDDPLDAITSFETVTITGGNTVDIGEYGIPAWYGYVSGTVFFDEDRDGIQDPGEPGIDGLDLTMRYRDGSVRYGAWTDSGGYYEFPEVFQLGKFYVTEVGFGRWGASGATYYPDTGAPPEFQEGALTIANLSWAAKRATVDWGKYLYDIGAGENGGISGIVFNAVTRNEIPARTAAAEDYETGIPSVTVQLWDATETTLLYEVQTDAWEHPTGCDYLDALGNPVSDPIGLGPNCIEVTNISTEIKEGLFDGGYAFTDICPTGFPCGGNEIPIPAGDYVVQVVPLPFFKVIQDSDQNTSEGNDLEPPTGPGPNLPAAGCIGAAEPVCATKAVTLNPGQNAAADFFLMPDFAPGEAVPLPGRVFGVLLDDLNVEINPNRVFFGEKHGIANTPIGIRDFTGRLITTVNTDENGMWEVLLPTTYVADCPTPSGVCPAVYTFTGNDPGEPGAPNPNFNPNFQTRAFALDVWAGKTTIADIAVFPITNLNGQQFQDPSVCEVPAGIPELHFVNSPRRRPTQVIRIDGTGFGAAQGSGQVTLDGIPLTDVLAWNDTFIRVRIDANHPLGPQQLMVTNNDGLTTPAGITIHVREPGGTYNPRTRFVDASAAPGGNGTNANPYNSIQTAIDNQPDGTLILVRPGTYYETTVNINHPVKIQGYGPGAPDGFGTGGSVLDLRFLDGSVSVTGTPGQYSAGFNPQIDGFRITNARAEQDLGGGVHADVNADYMEISNNVIQSNGGNIGGGITLGAPYVGDNNNDNISIHHNRVLNNGGLSRAGGIAIFNGADNYEIAYNDICGNFSGEYGGGISHFGLSNGGEIHHNRIYYNGAFDEGGGLMIAGEQFLGGAATYTVGSGDVNVYNNLFQGNQSNDDGGAIRLLQPWDYHIEIVNNMIVNNVSTDLAGGISLDDASDVVVANNTIAKNANTSTSEDSDGFAHGAGLVSEGYSVAFSDYLVVNYGSSAPGFPDPTMFNNIFWENQAYTWDGVNLNLSGIIDLEVFGAAGTHTGDSSNLIGTDPSFVEEYDTVLEAIALGLEPNFVTVVIVTVGTDAVLPGDYHLQAGSAAINSIGVSGLGAAFAPTDDFDDEIRPQDGLFDVGADESPGAAPSFPPTVAFSGLNDGDTVAGIVPLAFAASDVEDATPSLTVEWNVDGGSWQLATYNGGSGNFEASWDSTTVVDGAHDLNVRATDSDTNVTTESITVTVSNAGPTPTPPPPPTPTPVPPTPTPAPAGCTVNCLRVTDITFMGAAFGTQGRVRAFVTVENENGAPMPGARVFVSWDLPDGNTLADDEDTNGSGVARFNQNNNLGTFTLTITDVTLAGFTFDPDNSITSDSITVP